MEEFKIGDVVILKSGGPKMTVYQKERDTLYTIWFFENNTYKEGFSKDVIAKAD